MKTLFVVALLWSNVCIYAGDWGIRGGIAYSKNYLLDGAGHPGPLLGLTYSSALRQPKFLRIEAALDYWRFVYTRSYALSEIESRLDDTFVSVNDRLDYSGLILQARVVIVGPGGNNQGPVWIDIGLGAAGAIVWGDFEVLDSGHPEEQFAASLFARWNIRTSTNSSAHIEIEWFPRDHNTHNSEPEIELAALLGYRFRLL